MAAYRIHLNQIKRVLVVCPTTVILNWKIQIKRFSGYDAIDLHAAREERLRRLSLIDYNFYIINYEALPLFMSELFRLKFNMIIFDESARYIRNARAKRTRAAILLADKAKYKLILTGTPIANRPLDIWSQFRVLDGGTTFGSNFYSYRSKYFYKINIGSWPKWVVKKQAIPLLQKGMYENCIRFTRDILDNAPDRVYDTLIVPINSIEDNYNDIKRKIMSEIETMKGTVTLQINNILTKLLRLQQVTSGFIKNESGVEVMLTHTPKLDTLIEEVESIVDSGESVVVWCRFLFSIKMIADKLKEKKIKSITMQGSDKDKYAKWKGFQKSKDINVFIGQISAGGLGIELYKLDLNAEFQHMIFYEYTWTLDDTEQAKGRIDRIGQKSKCRYLTLYVEKTIDETMLEVIKERKKIADLIIERGVEEIIK